jgi:hypothetical protein
MSEMINFKLPEKNIPLINAGDWIENFMNGLGGDYVITGTDSSTLILANKIKCPNFCIGCNAKTSCDEMERILSRAITIFDPMLTAGFTSCAREKTGGCEITISSR